MFEKLKVAKNMIRFIWYSSNVKSKRIYRKCCLVYIFQSIILGRDDFALKFGSQYYDSFTLRFKDWVKFIYYSIITCFWRLIPDEKYRPKYIDYCIRYGVKKPIHLKRHIYVNECALEYFLAEHDLEIFSEYLTCLSSTYYIKKKQNNRKGG